jgi:AraC-like DNA-binding protein
VEQELVVRAAAPALRRYVRRYVGYAERTAEPARMREPASPGVVLIFGLGQELRVVDPDDPARVERHGSFFAGPADSCALVEHDGQMRGVEVNLTPLAARMLFREPMRALAGRTVAVEDLLGRNALELEERLLEAESWSRRFASVEAWLGERLLAADPPPPDVEWAWRRVTSARGRIRVSDLAAELGCSRKHLSARFREHVGLPPRMVVRLLRFGRAIEMLSSPHTTIADVAFACDYYDQAHLDRDFRDFASVTPTAYVAELRERVTSVQDVAAAAS